MRRRAPLVTVVAVLFFIAWLIVRPGLHSHPSSPSSTAIIHRNIIATTFWTGEPADKDSGHIANYASAWDSQWESHFGGVDDPNNRQNQGYWPKGFTPKENPFYFALPYDEFDDKGNVKPSAKRIPWYDPQQPPTSTRSILKNHWIRIMVGGRVAYAQWEDVGPTNEDDFAYVFGGASPSYAAGLDLSPATTIYLSLNGRSPVSWQFVDQKDVGSGPWLSLVTTSQIR